MSYDIPAASDFSTLEVGEVYIVPCVLKKDDKSGEYLPVYGILAVDGPALFVYAGSELAAEQRHYHLDERFYKWKDSFITADQLDDLKPTPRPMACIRATVGKTGPRKTNAESVEKYLIEHGTTRAIRCGNSVICPHKGARLDIAPGVMPGNARAVFICPQHGVAFDRDTLELVSQYACAKNKVVA